LAPQSILIASEEMVLPWELVVPSDAQGNNLPALGRAHVIGRWNPSWLKKPEPQRLRVRSGCLLSPTYTGRRRLRKASAEVTVVQSLMPRIHLNTAPDLSTVRREVLDAIDLQLLHFVGHGEFNVAQADDSALVLADETLLKARSFTGSALAAKASPVLYLNACAVGQTALVVGRPGGFCANFLRSGGTGVIAPYWPVNDDAAAEFARALYSKLLRNRSVGEALRELREEHPNDSTFQAFAWFGDPWASLDLNDLLM
jgi:CHAT domain-containing protein